MKALARMAATFGVGLVLFTLDELVELYDFLTGAEDEFQRFLADHPDVIVHRMPEVEP